MMKNMRLFIYIDTIVRTGSIRRAAEKLFITPSALDRRVQDLEDELGVIIFERHPKGMRLTAAGEVLLYYVRKHISDIQSLESQLDNLKGLKKGVISLSVSPALARSFVPRAINRFKENYPGIKFNIQIVQHEKAIQSLLNFEADIAIMVAPPKHSDILYVSVSNQPLLAILDSHHPLSKSKKLRMSDCVQYPLIITSTGLTSRVLFDSMVENCRNILNIAAELNSYELIPGLVKNTENIGFIISTGDTADYLIESLNMIPIDNPLKRTVPIVCAQLKNRSLSTAAAQFINYVSEDLNSVSQIYDHSSN